MPGKPLPDDAAEAQRLGRVAVRAADGQALASCHPARARALVRRAATYNADIAAFYNDYDNLLGRDTLSTGGSGTGDGASSATAT